MALTVDFYTFAKEENSTAKPLVGSAQASYNTVELKDDCSVVNPVIKLNVSMATAVYNWNYCYIPAFSRYYFIGDWVWQSGIWLGYLKVDVLASFKTAIGNSQVYVLRAYQNALGQMAYDGNVVDSTYPCIAQADSYNNSVYFDSQRNAYHPLAGYYGTNYATYIVGIVNKSASGVQYYAFDWLGFKQFCTQLYSYSNWMGNITEISSDLQKALVNPFQYVVSAFFLPIDFDWFYNNGIGTYTTTIEFGWWSVTTTAGGRILPSGVLYSFTTSLSIPKHPQATDRGAYLNLSPYSRYTLRYYPFGSLDIDSEAICNWNTLDLYTDIDICTGKAILNIAVNGKNNPLRTLQANVSVPIPTASINVDYMNLGTGTAIMAGASAFQQAGAGSSGNWLQNAKQNFSNLWNNVRSGNWSEIGAGLKETATNILSSALASKATAEIIGQQGSYTLYDTQNLVLSGRFLHIADEDFLHRGRPLCQMKVISTLSGYILCSDADISVACTDRELKAIKSFMETGFYYY